MKVGILTFQNTNNYGAFLQSYSLCSIIRAMGFDAELINYRNPSVTDFEVPRYPQLHEFFENPLRAGSRVTSYRNFSKRYGSFKQFITRYKLVGELIRGQAEMESNYDVIVVGSDQVWNPVVTGNDTTYFLDGVSCSRVYKIAYAASFGTTFFPEELKRKCGTALLAFDALSVRELNGQTLVKNLSGRESTVVLDPTLLFKKEDWEQVIEAGEVSEKIKKKTKDLSGYIFVYFAAEKQATLKAAKKAAKKLKAKVLISEGYRGFPSLGAGENVSCASPAEFLYLIQHAKAVVTSSFHGFALSLALNKQVYFSLENKPDNKNSRLMSLAQITGTQQCNIENGTFLNKDDLTHCIDYDLVNHRLNNERAVSLSFLHNALGKANQVCKNHLQYSSAHDTSIYSTPMNRGCEDE